MENITMSKRTTLLFPSLEDRLNYLSQLEYKLWADGEIVEHIWTKTSDRCEVGP